MFKVNKNLLLLKDASMVDFKQMFTTPFQY